MKYKITDFDAGSEDLLSEAMEAAYGLAVQNTLEDPSEDMADQVAKQRNATDSFGDFIGNSFEQIDAFFKAQGGVASLFKGDELILKDVVTLSAELAGTSGQYAVTCLDLALQLLAEADEEEDVEDAELNCVLLQAFLSTHGQALFREHMIELDTIALFAEPSSGRYVIADPDRQGGWSHIFVMTDIETKELGVRWVFDTQENRLHYGEVFDRNAWNILMPAEFEDLEDSVKNANSEALENPEVFGLYKSDDLPEWSPAE